MASSPDRPINVVFNEPELEPEILSEEETEEASVPAGRTAAVLTSPISFAGARLARLRPRRARQAPVEDVSQEPAVKQTLDTPAIVLGEENKIRQVVTNLLGNAVRFTNPGSPIEIGVSVDPARQVALLDIIDHGEGIPPQIRDKIFQRFWRADTSRTRETGGSGLGLAIVSGIIIAHKGSVEVLETEGGGATFRVVLPLLPHDWAAPAPTARP